VNNKIEDSDSLHELTIHLSVQVTDPVAVCAHPSAMHTRTGPDGLAHPYLPGSIEEAVVARFTTILDSLGEPTAGLRVIEHCEHLASWDHHSR